MIFRRSHLFFTGSGNFLIIWLFVVSGVLKSEVKKHFFSFLSFLPQISEWCKISGAYIKLTFLGSPGDGAHRLIPSVRNANDVGQNYKREHGFGKFFLTQRIRFYSRGD